MVTYLFEKQVAVYSLTRFSFLQLLLTHTAQKMKFSIKDFFSKCDQIRRKLLILSHLLKKTLIENVIFCTVSFQANVTFLCPLKTSENQKSFDWPVMGSKCSSRNINKFHLVFSCPLYSQRVEFKLTDSSEVSMNYLKRCQRNDLFLKLVFV